MSHVKIENVSKHFGDTQVLRDIELDIPHGEVLALLGPSGCGKTTLLRLIAGFDHLDGGAISFDGRKVASSTMHLAPERRGIGYVPQEGTLFPHLTVNGNVCYGLPRGAASRQRVDEVLELTGLAGLGRRFPHELSGGQQQRVALARALAPGPSLVLLDEPFNALDLDLRRGMCEDVIGVLRGTGTTAVLVTHDPGEAFAVSDHLAVMQAGEIMQCERPETVYWQPHNPSVARLTGAAIFLHGEIRQNCSVSPLGILPLHDSCRPGAGPAWIMLRPEQVALVGNSTEGVAGHVVHRSFRGDHTLLDLQLEGLRLSLRVSSLAAPALNEKVYLAVRGACMAFPGDGKSPHA
jgi:iron(III) transport system ATP-binding protein